MQILSQYYAQNSWFLDAYFQMISDERQNKWKKQTIAEPLHIRCMYILEITVHSRSVHVPLDH